MREQSDAMTTALNKLPEELREVWYLRLFEDLTLEEVAKQLGLGISAVRYRQRQAAFVYRQELRGFWSGRSHGFPGQSSTE